LQALKELIENDIEEEGYKQLIEIFPGCGDASGFTLKDIMNSNTSLIKK
jgi:hypothetical protein